jgi:hypothetical protein
MIIHIAALVLASQLVISVADNVPKFDIARGCKTDDTSLSGLNDGLDQTTKNCIKDEQTAQGQLNAQWSQFAPPDKALCTGEVTNTIGDGIPASYVELLTCLQGQKLAKKLPAN